jgi:2-methylcitrate dehydratase
VTLARRLAEYVLKVDFTKLDARTVKEAKTRVVDALGCAIGAYDEEPVAIARRAATGLGRGGTATLLGTRASAPPDLSTFVNGLMVRYFDFNDTYLSKEPAHPSDNLAPCLAVAEAEAKSGKELIAALVAAYEVQCRLCDAADLRHRGWDHVNYGLSSVSLAAAKLMGLGSEQATQALNIAVNGHIAMRQVRAGELSMWKGASFANAARNAVFAATLAREGMTGPSPIFEGEMGFFKQVSGPFKLDVGAFGGNKGGYRLGETSIKYWPAEYHAQTAVWASLEVRKKARPIGVKSVLVETHEAGYTILGKDREKWRPDTKETADHSLPYIVGMTLLHGGLDNNSYSAENLADKQNIAFVAKVKVREDPRLTRMYPAKGMPNRVTVELRNGKSFMSEVVVPKGHPRDPMTKEDVEAKFLRLTKGKLGYKRAKLALAELWNMEKATDLGELLETLRVSRQASNA